MRFEYHVITPMGRIENLPMLSEFIYRLGVQWHPLFDDSLKFRIKDSDWMHPTFCPPTPAGWAPAHHLINFFIDRRPLEMDHRYTILCDDDWYEPGFFPKIDAVDGSVLFCSMHRGQHQPANGPQYGTSTLVAARDNLKLGSVAAEQIILSGEELSMVRFGPELDSDGRIIEKFAAREDISFAPDAFVWFNYLQPGRWDK